MPEVYNDMIHPDPVSLMGQTLSDVGGGYI